MALFDVNHYFGGDYGISNIGDVGTVQGTVRGQQRILRRLLTNPGDYYFHPTYGAGLPRYIGNPIDIAKLQSLILSQMYLEDAVSRSPAPKVSVTQNANDFTAFNVSIAYNDAATRQPTVLNFSVSA